MYHPIPSDSDPDSIVYIMPSSSSYLHPLPRRPLFVIIHFYNPYTALTTLPILPRGVSIEKTLFATLDRMYVHPLAIPTVNKPLRDCVLAALAEDRVKFKR